MDHDRVDFFVSDEAGAAAGAAVAVIGGGAAAAASGAGAADAVLDGGEEVSTGAGGGAADAIGDICPPLIGIVATTREPILGGSMLTGCSSRETSLSVPACPEALDDAVLSAWAALLLGIILFGAMLALMIGGRLGNATVPNIAR